MNNTLFRNNCQIYIWIFDSFLEKRGREGQGNGRGPGGPGSIGGSLAGTGAPLYPHHLACANHCKIPVFSRKLSIVRFLSKIRTLKKSIKKQAISGEIDPFSFQVGPLVLLKRNPMMKDKSPVTFLIQKTHDDY